MVSKPCKVAGCERLNDSLGYCRLHYQRLRNGVNLDQPIRKKASKRGGCSVDGCTRPHKAKGYCDFHYKKHRMLTERCSIDGCERPRHTKEYCQAHYRRQSEGLGLDLSIRKKASKRGVCSVRGCARPHKAHGLCHTHYMAKRRADGGCSVPGCDGAHEAKGYCSKHYAQWRRGVLGRVLEEDPLVLEARERQRKIELYKWQLKIHKMFA